MRFTLMVLILFAMPCLATPQNSPAVGNDRAFAEWQMLNRKAITEISSMRVNEAQKTTARALRLAQTRLGIKSSAYATSVYNHGHALLIGGIDERGREQILRGIELEAALFGKSSLEVARSRMQACAIFGEHQRFLGLSDQLGALALQVFRADPKARVVETLECVIFISKTKRKRGLLQNAYELLTQARKVAQDPVLKFGPTYASIEQNIASLLHEAGRHTGSVAAAKNAISAYKRERSNAHANELLHALITLSDGQLALRKPKKAIATLREASAHSVKVWGKDSLQFAECSNRVGGVYEATGDSKSAITSHTGALRIRQLRLPAASREIAVSLNNLGNSYAASKLIEASKKSIGLYTKARTLLIVTKRLEDPLLALVSCNLAIALGKTQRFNESNKFFEESIRIHQKRGASPIFVQIRLAYANSLFDQKKKQLVKRQLTEVINLHIKMGTPRKEWSYLEDELRKLSTP